MRKLSYAVIGAALALAIISGLPGQTATSVKPNPASIATAIAKPEPQSEKLLSVKGTFKRGETFNHIFRKNSLDLTELHNIDVAARKVYKLTRITSGHEYTILYGKDGGVRQVTYDIDGESTLNISRGKDGAFSASKQDIEFEVRLAHRSGIIKDNLVSAMDDLLLALDLSDVFAWDIDFMTDIRRGDTFKMVVQEKWLDGEFKRFGKIMAAEFVNNGRTYYAYRFMQDGRVDYFNNKGTSLRRTLLKAPLSFRRISSRYTRARFHPILKRYRPHLGVDYAAASGTPVSSVGDGTVVKSGYNGPNGKQVVIRHMGGFTTYYGHLSRISKGIRRGARVKQGQVIGKVGSTGRSTGPHLDYRIKKNGGFINPLRLKLPPGKPIKTALLADFNIFVSGMSLRLAAIKSTVTATIQDGPDGKKQG